MADAPPPPLQMLQRMGRGQGAGVGGWRGGPEWKIGMVCEDGDGGEGPGSQHMGRQGWWGEPFRSRRAGGRQVVLRVGLCCAVLMCGAHAARKKSQPGCPKA